MTSQRFHLPNRLAWVAHRGAVEAACLELVNRLRTRDEQALDNQNVGTWLLRTIVTIGRLNRYRNPIKIALGKVLAAIRLLESGVIDLCSSCFAVGRLLQRGRSLRHAAQAAKTAEDRPSTMSSHARETHTVARVTAFR